VAKKLIISAIAAAAVSGLVAASFLADSFDGYDAINPIGWLFPLLLLVGIGAMVAAAVWAVRS